MTGTGRRSGYLLVAAIAAASLLTVLFPGRVGAASFDPAFRFRTRTTPHFEIHYHQGLEPMAERLAAIAEGVQGRMSRLLRWEPRERTQVVLVDAMDLANGFSTSLPYNAIYLYPVPPPVDSSIGEYGDWLENLFVHEYAHVLTTDPSRGYSTWTRAVFGKPLPAVDLLSLTVFLLTAPPNTFLPQWWHEGAATWAETAFTDNGGRGRGAYAEMVYRMAVAEDALPTVDQANESLPGWPGGNVPYLFGLRLMRQLSGTEGEGAVGAASEGHAGRFPYALNGVPERLFREKEYKDLYREAMEALRVEQAEKSARIRAAGVTAAATVRDDGEQLTSPRFSPDGRLLAWRREDPHGPATIEVAESATGKKVKSLRPAGFDGSLAWSPDGDTLYFTRAAFTLGGYGFRRDLFSHTVSTGKGRRLTRGKRLSDPDASPDGKTLAAVATGDGRQRLLFLSPPVKGAGERWTEKGAMDTEGESRLSRPRWSPDGSRVAVVETDGRTGASRLVAYSPATRERRVVAEGDSSMTDPAWSRDGANVLFVSAGTGVFNLFAVPAEGGRPLQVTNLEGGAFGPEPSVDGRSLIFSEYHSKGFSLASIPYDPSSWRGEAGPRIDPAWPATASARPTASGIVPAAGRGAPGDVGTPPADPSYSPVGTVLPRFWLPVLLSDHEGAAPGAFTAARDVLGRHSAFLLGAVGIPSGEPYFAASYAYDRLYPTLLLEGWSLPVLYSELVGMTDYFERSTGVDGRVEIPLFRRHDTRYGLSIGGRFERQTALTDLAVPPFDNAAVSPFEGNRGGAIVSATFTNAKRYPYSISPEAGRDIALSFRNDSRSLGDISRREWTGRWSEYLGLPGMLLRHHVLLADFRGGTSDGDNTLQGAFQMGGPPSLLSAFPLRGYPSRFEPGRHVATATAEYRFPVWSLYRGPGTAPFFLHRLHGALFVDTGETWSDGVSFSGSRLRTGVGAELKADVTIGYLLRLTPGIGVAYGFNEGGESQAYFRLEGVL